MADYETRTRRFTRAEYERLIDLGVFQPGEAIELIGGELMVAEPQGAAHYTAIRKSAKALEAAFGPGWEVRTEGPIGLDEDSEPEPDVAVVPGSRSPIRQGRSGGATPAARCSTPPPGSPLSPCRQRASPSHVSFPDRHDASGATRPASVDSPRVRAVDRPRLPRRGRPDRAPRRLVAREGATAQRAQDGRASRGEGAGAGVRRGLVRPDTKSHRSRRPVRARAGRLRRPRLAA